MSQDSIEMIMPCPIHNSIPENCIPDKNNTKKKQVCQLCIQQPNELIPIQQQQNVIEKDQVNSQSESQFDQNIEKPISDIIIQKVKLQDENINYKYQLLPQSTNQQSSDCYDIAFNNDASIVVAGDWFDIKVFEFKEQILKQIQILKGHESWIKCLQFMKKSDQFISGCWDGLIKIWSQNNQNEWINIQTLEGHQDHINFLIINQKEDLIISGGGDDLIIFWSLNNNQWSLNQKLEIECLGSYASLNDSNNKLIFFKHRSIQILEKQGNQWIVTQQIESDESSFSKLQFINDFEFVVLPYKCKSLKFYTLNQVNNYYEMRYEVEVRKNQYYSHEGFPINYIKSKQLLIAKNGNYVNILRKQGDGLFQQEDILEFQNSQFSGRVSDDGQFFIIWDSHNEEFQVRILKEIK